MAVSEDWEAAARWGSAGAGAAGVAQAWDGAAGLNFQCFQNCTTDRTATQALLSAVTCTFQSCSSPCVGALTGGGGPGGLGRLGGLGGLGGVGETSAPSE